MERVIVKSRQQCRMMDTRKSHIFLQIYKTLDWKKECLANVLSLEKKWFSLLVSRRAGPIDYKTASERPSSGTENQRNCSRESVKESKVLREGNQFLYFKASGSTLGTGNQRVDDSVLR